MKYLLCAMLLWALCGALFAEQWVTIEQGDRLRRALVVAPAQGDGPRPMVILMHGGGGSPQHILTASGYAALARRDGVILVVPEGVDRQWNDGRGKTYRRSDEDLTAVDDVAFLDALIAHMVAGEAADAQRVMMTGVSNGGMMTMRYVLEGDHQLRAMATLIANLPQSLADRTVPYRLSTLVLHGDSDPLIPWQGGSVRVLGKDLGTVLSARETLDFWAAPFAIKQGDLQRESLPDRHPHDQSTVFRSSYANLSHQLLWYHVQGGGHQVPSTEGGGRRLLGPHNRDMDATVVVWDWLMERSAVPVLPSPLSVVCIGDSHTAKGIWPQAMEKALGAELQLRTLAAGGLTAGQMLERLRSGQWSLPDADPDADAKADTKAERSIALIMAGTNGYHVDELEALVAEVARRHYTVLVLTAPPRHADSQRQWTPAHANRQYNDALRQRFAAVAPTAQGQLIDVVPALANPSHDRMDLIQPAFNDDGVHLNEAGYQRLGQVVAQALHTWLN